MLRHLTRGTIKEEALKVKGQLVYFDREEFRKYLLEVYRGYGVENAQAQADAEMITQVFEAGLDAKEKYFYSTQKDTKRTKQLDRAETDFVRKHLGYKGRGWRVTSYSSVKSLKTDVGKLFLETLGPEIREQHPDRFLRAQVSGAQRPGQAIVGRQVGHGDLGFSVSAMKASGAANVLGNALASGRISALDENIAPLIEAVANFQHTMPSTLDITKTMAVTTKGKFAAKFVPILTLQDALENSEHAKLEQAAIRGMIDTLRKAHASYKLIEQKGSPSIKDAIEETFLENFDNIKGTKLKTKKKPKKSVKSKTKSKKVKGNITTKAKARTVNIQPRDPATGRFISREKATNPYNILAMINAKLPGVLAKNMVAPALVYRTGRFAQSVEAVGVRETKAGNTSIDYTYMKYPYQTFEPGYAMGSEQRDPRKLIDKSIREIAAGFATTRFFTRRV
jgi:hypothetical protein